MQISTICKLALHRRNPSLTELKLAYAYAYDMQATTQEANEAILDKQLDFPIAAYNYKPFHSHTL